MNQISRRHFVRLTSGAAAGTLLQFKPLWASGASVTDWDPQQPLVSVSKALKVQPVLMYRVAEPRPQTSWKSWGSVQTEATAREEAARINNELESVAQKAEFPIQVLQVIKVKTAEEAQAVHRQDHDAILVYACTGGGDLLRACFAPQGNTLIFVRHRSGPVYYWYEALSTKYLSTQAAEVKPAPADKSLTVHVDDVVVDDYQELLWKLRALVGVKNLRGTRIVALGGTWGKYASEAPQDAHSKFQLEITESSYDELARRIKQARADQALVSRAEKWAAAYLELPQTTLRTDRPFVVNAFLLYYLFKEMMRENRAEAFTVKSCMGTIIPMSETTACLALSLLNDEGLMAFCESDFVIIPAGILLRHVAAKPVFLHNSTFPHQRLVTCAHCTAPRRMDGQTYYPARIVTHYESDYGAAPKVEMPIGQEVTFIDPEYSVGRWVGFKGVIKDNPSYDICRSQQDVEIQGHWEKLKREVRDSHWMMVCGDYLKEAGFAARKLGLQWENISEA